MAGRKGARGKKLRNRGKACLHQPKAHLDIWFESDVDRTTIDMPSTNLGSHLELSECENNDNDECHSAGEYSTCRSRILARRTHSHPQSYGRRLQDSADQTSQSSLEDDGGEELIFSGRGSPQKVISQQSVPLKSTEPLREKPWRGSCESGTSFHQYQAGDSMHSINTVWHSTSHSINSPSSECLHGETSQRRNFANHSPEFKVYEREAQNETTSKEATESVEFVQEQVESDFSADTIPLDVVDDDESESSLEVEETSFDMDGMSDDAFLNEMTKYVHKSTLKLENVGGIQSLLPDASPLDFELSDKELQAQMRSSWQNDRQKKALRKQARAELHRKGEFNRSSRVKSTKLGLDEVINEINAFIASDQSMLELQPIPKFQRKIVHEIAHAYDLTSKSTGHGLLRHPCLYKRSRSKVPDGFDAYQFSRRMKHSKGNRWPNPSTISSAAGSTLRHHKNSRGGAAKYLEGEVVGAAAPELDANNRGHAMLEKMGWNAGTPLGRDDNQGRLNPIWHVVKSSRAGLG